MVGTDSIWEGLCYYRDTKILTDARNQVILSRFRVLDMLMRLYVHRYSYISGEIKSSV